MADQVLRPQGGLREAALDARATLGRIISRDSLSNIARPLGLILIAQLGISLLFLLNNTSGEITGLSLQPIDEARVRMVYDKKKVDSF